MRIRFLPILALLGGCSLPDIISVLELTKNAPAETTQIDKGSEYGARAVLTELVRKQAHPDRRNDTLAYHPAAQLSDKQGDTQARWKLTSGRRPSNNASKMVFRPSETKAADSGD